MSVAAEEGTPVRVVHPIELIDEAIRGAVPRTEPRMIEATYRSAASLEAREATANRSAVDFRLVAREGRVTARYFLAAR